MAIPSDLPSVEPVPQNQDTPQAPHVQSPRKSFSFKPTFNLGSSGFRFPKFFGSKEPKLVERVTVPEGEIGISYVKYQLANGLTVVIHEDHSNPKAYVNVTYNVGSRNESPGYTGFAHLYEHMMFEGSRHIESWGIPNMISAMGGTFNGTTNKDRTNYYEEFPVHNLETVLWAEADRMGTVLDRITPEAFESQRAAVKNEKAQGENKPLGDLMHNNFYQALYPSGHPYSWPTIGHSEDLDLVQVEDVRDFYHRWYGPNNATLVISGDVNETETMAWVQKYFGSIPTGPRVERLEPMPITLGESRYVTFEDSYIQDKTLMKKAYPTVEVYHADEAPIDMLVSVFASGKGSILDQTFGQSGVTQSSSLGHPCSLLSGFLRFQVEPADGYSLSDMESLWDEALTKLEKLLQDEEEVQRLLDIHYQDRYTSHIDDIETIEERADHLVNYELRLGRSDYFKEDIARYRHVTPEDLRRVYDQYIKGKPHLTQSVVPAGQTELAARPSNFELPDVQERLDELPYRRLKRNRKLRDDFDRSVRPEPKEPGQIALPTPWDLTLDSGVQVMGAKHSEQPIVSVELRFQAGEAYSSADQLSAGGFLCSLLRYSTENNTPEEISDRLKELGSTISFSRGRDYISIDVWSLDENLDETLALAEDMIFNPEFNSDEFERIKSQKIKSWQQYLDSPTNVANTVFNVVTYEDGHAVTIPHSEGIAAIEAMTLEDVKRFYRDVFLKNGAEVFVVGHILPDEAQRSLSFMNQWNGQRVERTLSIPKSPEPTKIYLVDVPGAQQSVVKMGYRHDVDWDPVGDSARMSLMNRPLGANASARLFEQLRNQKDYTYGAYSGFSFGDEGGVFSAYSNIKVEVTAPALQEMIDVITDYRDNGPTQEEWDVAVRSDILGNLMSYETRGSIMNYVKDIYTDSLPADYLAQNQQYVGGLTLGDIQDEAQISLQPENMTIVVVGDRATIEDSIRGLGYEVVLVDREGNPLVEETTP